MMETISRKGIPYKSNENKQTTNVMIRLTESQKEIFRGNATKNNQTISEYIRTLAIKATSKK
jgi:uncharacterized protein (DUF1778 family)